MSIIKQNAIRTLLKKEMFEAVVTQKQLSTSLGLDIDTKCISDALLILSWKETYSEKDKKKIIKATRKTHSMRTKLTIKYIEEFL